MFLYLLSCWEIIKTVLSAPETYAVCLKEDNKAIGSIGLMVGAQSNIGLPDTEGEIGYWIGVPFWGQGLIPEAVREMIHYAFTEKHLETLWCGYFEGNDKSRLLLLGILFRDDPETNGGMLF